MHNDKNLSMEDEEAKRLSVRKRAKSGAIGDVFCSFTYDRFGYIVWMVCIKESTARPVSDDVRCRLSLGDSTVRI